MTTRSTNQEDFLVFLVKIVQGLKRGIKRPYLVLDNHTAHRTKRVKELLSQHFNVLYLPVASSEFNSVERVWSVIKQRYMKMAAAATVQTQEDLAKIVEETLAGISAPLCRKLAGSNRETMRRTLEEVRL
jgi:transposase